MSRRRERRLRHGEAFGTSLADILTTALGCVLLLFLVAVMNIRQALSTERAAHESTQKQLVAEEEDRKVAEQQKQVVLGKKTAIERALQDALAAKGEAERALRAQSEQRRALAAKKQAIEDEKRVLEEQLASKDATLEDLRQRFGRLREAATNVVSRLDPGQLTPVDLMLVIDGTRSMEPSLDAVRRDLGSLVTALGVVSSSARVGVVVFRDRREAEGFRLQTHPLTTDIDSLSAFLSDIKASSTGVDDDLPEWLLGGLQRAAKASFRPEAVRLVVAVSDAATQDEQTGECVAAAKELSSTGARVFVMSTLPSGYDVRPQVAAEFQQRVLPEHEAIARAGGGSHLKGTGSDALVHEVLKATLHTKTVTPLSDLRELLDETAAPAPSPSPPDGP